MHYLRIYLFSAAKSEFGRVEVSRTHPLHWLKSSVVVSRLHHPTDWMGGTGKTQLALEYCRCMKDEKRYRAIFWLDASSPA